MLITPQMSAEVDELLKKAQEDLVKTKASIEKQGKQMPTTQELTTLKLKIGDIDLLIKRNLNNWRR